MKPILLWLAIQLSALAIGAAGVPLSMQRQAPPETLSIQLMIVAQVCGAAFFWPVLFREWRAAIAVISITIPFTFAAGFLSAASSGTLISVAVMLCVWLLTLAVLPRSQLNTTSTTALHMLVVLWSIGGALVTYLHAEFSNSGSALSLGPAVRIVARARGASGNELFFECAVVIAISIFARAIQRRKPAQKKVNILRFS